MTNLIAQDQTVPEAIEIYPSQIQFLDIRIPNSPAYSDSDWIVQIVTAIRGELKYLNSKPFNLRDVNSSK